MPLGLTFGDNRPPASKSARQLVGADESRGQPVRRCRHPRTDASRYDIFDFRGKPHVSALTRRTLLSSVGPSGDRRRPCNEPAMPLSPTAPHRTINMPGYVPTRPVPRSSRCHHRDCRDASTWLMTRSSNSSIYPDDLDLASYRSDTTGNSRATPRAVGASAEIGVMAPSSESARFRKKACHRRRSCRHEDGLTKAEEKSCRRRTTVDAARDHRTHRASARKTWCPAPCRGRGIGNLCTLRTRQYQRKYHGDVSIVTATQHGHARDVPIPATNRWNRATCNPGPDLPQTRRCSQHTKARETLRSRLDSTDRGHPRSTGPSTRRPKTSMPEGHLSKLLLGSKDRQQKGKATSEHRADVATDQARLVYETADATQTHRSTHPPK